MLHQVKRLVLEVLEEPVLLEVVRKKREKKNEINEKLYKNNYEFKCHINININNNTKNNIFKCILTWKLL